MLLIVNRQGLIVWFQHMKNMKHIKRYGNLIYISKKLKYAVIYVNQEEIEAIEKKLLKHSFVLKVDRSYKPYIRTDYDNSNHKEEVERTYDYKMGI